MQLRRIALVVVALVVSGCSGSSASEPASETSAAPTSTNATGDLAAACADLRDLADQVLAFQSDQSDAQGDAVLTAAEAFDRSARASGDAELVEEAGIALDGLEAYFAGGSDTSQGGKAADAAFDQAGKRCLDSGAVDVLPTEPE